MSPHCLLGSMLSDKKIFVISTETPLYVTSHFSLSTFKIFYSFHCCLFNYVCLSLSCLEVSLILECAD